MPQSTAHQTFFTLGCPPIVVARLEEDVTVKRFKRDGKKIVLLPENPDFEPIVVDPSQDFLAIEGLAVGVIRNPRSGL